MNAQTQQFLARLATQRSETFEVELEGRRALFTDPSSKPSGHKVSYPAPTYESIKAILKGVYAKPNMEIVVESVRVMNKIQKESYADASEIYGYQLSRHGDSPSVGVARSLRFSLFLRDVRYRVKYHFRWNLNQTNLIHDCDMRKHVPQVLRHMQRGGKKELYFGIRECTLFLSPLTEDFGAGNGYYDNSGRIELGRMYHSMRYPTENPVFDTLGRKDKNGLYKCFWDCSMADGIIEFPHPDTSVAVAETAEENEGKLVHERLRSMSEYELRLFPDNRKESDVA